jgi:hypothetical protein
MIDLNTATAKELYSVLVLKGYGFEIVRYREERGRFISLRQLNEVPDLSGKSNGMDAHVSVSEGISDEYYLSKANTVLKSIQLNKND